MQMHNDSNSAAIVNGNAGLVAPLTYEDKQTEKFTWTSCESVTPKRKSAIKNAGATTL